MKLTATTTLPLILALSVSSHAFAQEDMKGMDMKDMEKKQTHHSKTTTHKANAIVKEIDVSTGMVTLAHDPIKSLGWPAMTMAFAVKDKALLDKLAVGKKVHVKLSKQGDDYVITSVK